ncbi:uncharacterized protein I303_102268 [Kwoniella dejecticola CBS 10117]|uniref:Derlin n=1 Tax=Kwoniella dejecticola CBS 10117 TaxID=1296121 RepID=A0A1A6ABF3_9TREE|nr:derlin-2/3 [Kwoniella dejecticola CBS 10117]OBR87390.1 derlin-2/3 [Kwoniella dejecticola CBS 10117]
MADFSAVVNAVPPVTRTLLIATAAVTFPCLLGIISPATIALIWPKVLGRFEIWRPFTSFFFGGSGFPLIYDFFLIYRNSSAMERDIYRNDTAEYAWLHLMLASFITIFNSLVGLPFLFRPLLHAQTYVWCRANPTLKVSIFGLLTIPTSLYPPALIVLDLLTGGPMKALGGILGLLSGHLWWFIATYLPLHAPTHLRRPNPLAPPIWFRRIFNAPSSQRTGFKAYRPEGSSTAASPTDPAAAVRHRWGGGQRLGGSSL